MNLLAPDIIAEMTVLVTPDFSFRMISTKIPDKATGLQLAKIMFAAADQFAQAQGLRVEVSAPPK